MKVGLAAYFQVHLRNARLDIYTRAQRRSGRRRCARPTGTRSLTLTQEASFMGGLIIATLISRRHRGADDERASVKPISNAFLR